MTYNEIIPLRVIDMPRPTPRERNASATRADLLAAARRAFSRAPIGRVTLRRIADDAGVDPALVARYFGSKASLFTEAVDGPDLDDSDLETALYGRLEDLPAALARHVLHCQGADFDPLVALLHSSGDPTARELLDTYVQDELRAPLAARLRASGTPRKEATARAHHTAALLVGATFTHCVVSDTPLSEDALDLLSSTFHDALSLDTP